jgi:hypothetical protein
MSTDQRRELSELAGATGVWLFQWCALIPGLLPILALTVVFALPVAVAATAPVALLLLPYGAWRAGRRALGVLR